MSTKRAVVLARGLGTRMRVAEHEAVLTGAQQRAADAGFKAMMPIGGRPFLDYVLSALADAGLRDVALVVAPDHELVRRYYREQAQPSRVELTFVVQDEPHGTADAVLAARFWTEDQAFLTMNGDNLYPVEVLRDLAALDEPGLPVFERGDLVASGNIPPDRVRAFALVESDERGYLTRVIEKPPIEAMQAAGERARVSMNCWRFDSRIFAACRDVPGSARGEFELPEAVALAVQRGVRFRTLPARGPVLDLSRRADAAEVSRVLAGVVPSP
ncbi:MAG TPA: nucleotidyltransferase family protein [Vicinamibacterales bacterium]|nr:nucleotidyltransferase family protein [Vicinamibacterales bacterium]